MFNRIGRYFDLNSNVKSSRRVLTTVAPARPIYAFPQWFALLAGIFIQPYMATFRETGHWNFTGAWGWLLFSVCVGIVIFPGAYRHAVNQTQPWLLLVAPCFTAGLGWQTLFSTAEKWASH